jgi:hypothetical protein
MAAADEGNPSPWLNAAQALLGTYVQLPGDTGLPAVGRVIGFDVEKETFTVDFAVVVLTLSETELLELRAPEEAPSDKTPRGPHLLMQPPLHWAPGGRASFDPPTREAELRVHNLNTALPRPLAPTPTSVVPYGRIVGDHGESLLPPEARGAVFQTAAALGHLATLYRWGQEAAQFVGRAEVAANAEAAGVKPLKQLKVAALRGMCEARGLVGAGLKSLLVGRLEDHAAQARMTSKLFVALCFSVSPTATTNRRVIAETVCSFMPRLACFDMELEPLVMLAATLSLPSSYHAPVGLADFKVYVESLEVGNRQREAAALGLYYRPLKGQPSQVTDPDHNFHNWMTKIIWGQDGGDPKSFAVSIEHLLAAAKALKTRDEVCEKVLTRSSDKHAHACSLYVTIHAELIASLRTLGHDQDATVLEAVGQGWRAWKQRGLTMHTRLGYLSHLRLVIYRLIGVANMTSASVLRGQHLAGAQTNQWLDMLSAIDVFEELVSTLSPEQIAKFNASSITSRTCEGEFSHLSSNTCSGEKMTMEQVQGKVRRMDSLYGIKRLENGPYTYQISSRKRKLDTDTSGRWSDGTANSVAFFKEFWGRAKGYCGNRATIRDVNAGHGGQ